MEIALKRGDICHIRLNDSQIINDVYYLEDVDNAGKRMHKFGNGLQEYMVCVGVRLLLLITFHAGRMLKKR